MRSEYMKTTPIFSRLPSRHSAPARKSSEDLRVRLRIMHSEQTLLSLRHSGLGWRQFPRLAPDPNSNIGLVSQHRGGAEQLLRVPPGHAHTSVVHDGEIPHTLRWGTFYFLTKSTEAPGSPVLSLAQCGNVPAFEVPKKWQVHSSFQVSNMTQFMTGSPWEYRLRRNSSLTIWESSITPLMQSGR